MVVNKRRLVFVNICLVFILFLPISATAGDELFWPYFHFPPLFIEQGDRLTGTGIRIRDLLQQKLPQYDHKNISASPKRIMERISQGEPWVAVGPIKTAAREKFMYYSLPCRLGIGSVLIVHREAAKGKLKDIQNRSLEDLYRDTTLRFGYFEGTRSGLGLNKIIAKYPRTDNLVKVSGPDGFSRLLLMIAAKRVDWIIGDPIMALFLARENGVADQVVLMPHGKKGLTATVGYIAGPKNEWGRLLITRIDEILAREVPTDTYFNIFEPWIDKTLMPDFRTLYDEYLVQPTLDYRKSRITPQP